MCDALDFHLPPVQRCFQQRNDALMKLLIVDDHVGVRKLIRELVAHLTTEICECEDGEQAVLMSAKFLPDFVIMDLQMPGIDGFEATRRVLAGHPQARVIAVSHLKHPELEERARSSGACYFIRKENLFDLARYLGRCLNI
jgi:two-component system invasion response regulator UvrY